MTADGFRAPEVGERRGCLPIVFSAVKLIARVKHRRSWIGDRIATTGSRGCDVEDSDA